MSLPTVALFTGDPAGIGPELVEKLLAAPDWQAHAQVVLIAQEGALKVPGSVRWHDWSGRRARASTWSHPAGPMRFASRR
jgi:4-hydroxythreonine-4-phosphate dehydrogenase